MADVLVLRDGDDVAVALGDLAPGECVPGGAAAGVRPRVVVRTAVPAGHKVALRGVPAGAQVRKYGEVIGVATTPIEAGDHVHVHNLAFVPSEVSHQPGTRARPATPAPGSVTFDGFVRPDGRVGTRNYLGVLTSVNCSATVAKLIARKAQALVEASPHVDGVVALTHGTGCGMASSGEGLEILRRTLSGYAAHPNFAGIVAVGLGCEVNQLADLDLTGCPTPVRSFTIQEAGGTTAAAQAGADALASLLPEAEAARRTPVPASALTLGLNCGGSDAFSGMTANPALGAAVDLLVAHGGTAVLAETPEIYGAEHMLTARAASREVAGALLARIAWWDAYTAASGASMDANPSPGNKAGGITTILEKSLGAIAKGGSTPLCGVYEYAQPVTAKGLVFMDTPGYDPVSVTGIVAGGAQLVCFTTGRGSVFGAKPAPSLKLCSNSRTYAAMTDDMDVNCGVIADGDATVAEVGKKIFDLVLDVASGHATASELLGFGDEEFTPWQLGAVL
jgi:arabinonate dehydratase